jgi:DNA replication and repair protein RecF
VRVDELGLADFRNYREAELAFAPGLNLIVGRNAQGKTNLLEAVYCLGGLGSPRSSDAAVIRAGCERAVLHALVSRGDRSVRVDLEFRQGKGTRALVNRTPVETPRVLGGIAVSVFFGPDELALIKGSPDGRRRLLDDLVIKLRPGRYTLRREFDRVLKQRNALLKTAPRGSPEGRIAATLEVWDEALCDAGAAVVAARLEVLGALVPRARARYREISGGAELHLGYWSSWLHREVAEGAVGSGGEVDAVKIREVLADELAAVRGRELERGVSLAGPQRDDLYVELASGREAALDARTFASQGDQRSAALSLKLGEHDLLTAELGEQPILLLDDVFSELDPDRRRWLADVVRGMDQAILTAVEPGAAKAADAGRVFHVSSGEVTLGG